MLTNVEMQKKAPLLREDTVFIKQICRNKITLCFNHTPYIVVSRTGTFDSFKSEDNASAMTHKDNNNILPCQAYQQSDHREVEDNECKWKR